MCFPKKDVNIFREIPFDGDESCANLEVVRSFGLPCAIGAQEVFFEI